MPIHAWVRIGGLALTLAWSLPGSARADDLSASYDRGMQLYRQQRFAEAVPQFEKVVRLSEQLYGAEDPKLSVDLNNLGEAYRRAGRLPEAARSLERAIRLDRKLGGETPALATSLNNLALVYRGEGRVSEAMPLHERALSILRGSLGAQHPDVARALNNQAITTLAGGRSSEATEIADQALTIARASLGPDDPTTRAIAQTLERARRTPASEPALARGPAPAPIPAVQGKTLPPPPSAMAALPAPLAAPPPRATPQVAAAPVAPKPPSPAAPLPPAPAARAAVAPAPPAAVPKPAPAKPSAPVGGAAKPPASVAALVPAAPPAASAKPGGRYALHLGSVRSAGAAGGEWRRLLGLHPSLAALRPLDPEAVEVAGKGTFYRVLAGYLPSMDAARTLCGSVRTGGTSCDVRAR